MKPLENAVDAILITLGTTYSLANIEQMLGVIILTIQAIWLVVKLIVKIYNAIKNNKNLEQFDNEIDNAISYLEDARNKLNSKENENVDSHNKSKK